MISMDNVKNISLEELWPLMAEQIAEGKSVRFGPKGISMLPLVRQFQDTVVIKKAPEKLKKYDIPLYRRDNGQFVLHRVVGENADGYIMCGDNQCVYEYGITDKHILALAEGLYRGDEYVSFADEKYISYSHRRVRRQAFKRFLRKSRLKAVIILKKMHIFAPCRKIYYIIRRK